MDPSTRVLIVAEREDEREMYFTGLALEGFAVMCGGIEGDLAAAATQLAPALIVLVLEHADDADWNRARALHGQRGTEHIPIVIVTAAVRSDGANRRIARQLGNCAAFIAKPCDHRTLAAVVRRVIAGERHIEEVHHPSSFA